MTSRPTIRQQNWTNEGGPWLPFACLGNASWGATITAFCLVLLPLWSGCDGSYERPESLDPDEVESRLMPAELRVGQLAGDGEGGASEGILAWESAPLPRDGSDCQRALDESGWLDHPAGVQTRIAHGLGRAPMDVTVYLSFDTGGCRASQAAGDLVRLISTDERQVTVENGTGESFYMRLVLR